MPTVGFRCEADAVRYVVTDGTRLAPLLVASERLRFPVNMTRPAQLSWLRREVSDLLGRVQPSAVCYKKAESGPRTAVSVPRVEAEAVIQLTAHEAGIGEVQATVKRSLKAALGYDGEIRYVTRAIDEMGLDGVGRSEEEREAALAAITHLPEG